MSRPDDMSPLERMKADAMLCRTRWRRAQMVDGEYRKKSDHCEKADKRREDIADLFRLGWNQLQIAEQFGISEATVSKDMVILRKAGKV